MRVELHRTLDLLAAPPSLVWDRLSAGTRAITMARTLVRVPSDEASVLIVALHAAQHGIDEAKPLADLGRALERVNDEVWAAAGNLARDLGGESAFAAGLRLEPRGRELARRLGLPTAASRAVRLQATSAINAAVRS